MLPDIICIRPKNKTGKLDLDGCFILELCFRGAERVPAFLFQRSTETSYIGLPQDTCLKRSGGKPVRAQLLIVLTRLTAHGVTKHGSSVSVALTLASETDRQN